MQTQTEEHGLTGCPKVGKVRPMTSTQTIQVGSTSIDIPSDATHEVVTDTRISAANREVTTAYRTLEQTEHKRLNETEAQHNQRKTDAETALTAAQAQVAKFAENYTGWSRYFLVMSSNGHIHSHMDCSTCHNGRGRTVFGWLTDMSGLTEADAVSEYGGILCTVCYPTAPTEWTEGESREKTENRWYRMVLRSPEGKALVKAQKKVADLEWRIGRGPDEIERLVEYAGRQAEWAERAEAEGDTDLAASHTRQFDNETERAVQAERKLARALKALPKAQDAVKSAQAALDAAIVAAGLD